MRNPTMTIRVLAIAGGMFLTAAAQAQTTWYVDNGNCPGPGSGSEGDPFCKIQDGIDASASGDEVVVADGTYTGDGNRDLDFGGRNITLRSASGDPTTCIIDCQGSEGDQHSGFYLHSGETNDSVIVGFTISNGYSGTGGGIYCDQSAPTITNCIVIGCTALYGGGMSIVASTGTVISDCLIIGNTAIGAAGGIGIYPGALGTCAVTITNCTISNNTGRSICGGMYCGGGSTATMSNCTISGNVELPVATCGTGGITISGDAVTIIDCTIADNSGTSSGAISAGWWSNVIISNCAITGNTASPGDSGCGFVAGGGIRLSATTGQQTVTNCIVSGNVVMGSRSDGGGGGIYLAGTGEQTIANCIIAGNTSDQLGGGVLARATSENSRLINCTITGNSAAQVGGGLALAALPNEPATATLSNCVLWNNDAPNGPELALRNSSPPWNTPSTLTVSHGDVQGGQAAAYVEEGSELIWGPGNIDADPLFVDPDNDDYHVPVDSPVIDAADNSAVPPDSADLDGDGDTDEPTPFDLDGNARIVDGDGDEEADVDMGAYEFQTDLPCPWDLNADGTVGPFDLAFVLGFWGPNPGHPSDINGDGVVGPLDLALVLGNWGPCP